MSIDVTAGDPASEAALARVAGQVAAARESAAAPYLSRAVAALNAASYESALQMAEEAIARDGRSGAGWRLAAIAHEKLGRYAESLASYEAALQLLPDEAEIAGDLGRLALRMGMHELAEKLLRRSLAHRPQSLEVANNLAHALREQHRYAEAIEVLRPLIEANPGEAALWNSLGVILTQQGEPETALIFFDQALQLEPGSAAIRYYRGNAATDLGRHGEALADYRAALASGELTAADASKVKFAMSLILLAQGDLEKGWEAYVERRSPANDKAVEFQVDARPWRPGDELEGRSLLLIGEQGLGDEVMFANVVPDVLEALGEDGRLALAVEERLVPLFARAFPEAVVVSHITDKTVQRAVRSAPAVAAAHADLWAPLADLLRQYRACVDDFPDRGAFLTPDPERVGHWRAALSDLLGLKVGILWKSLKLHGERMRQFAPFQLWAPVLRTPGVSFVNLQYGDCAEELRLAREELGIEVREPAGIDLKDDLDDVAALCRAVDLVIGFANATTNLAGACGAPTWLILPPVAWPQLGTDAYPWYPQARCFRAAGYDAWDEVMAEVARALAEEARGRA